MIPLFCAAKQETNAEISEEEKLCLTDNICCGAPQKSKNCFKAQLLSIPCQVQGRLGYKKLQGLFQREVILIRLQLF